MSVSPLTPLIVSRLPIPPFRFPSFRLSNFRLRRWLPQRWRLTSLGPDPLNLIREFSPAERFRQKSPERRQRCKSRFKGCHILAAHHDKDRLRHPSDDFADELYAGEMRHVIVRDDHAGIQPW